MTGPEPFLKLINEVFGLAAFEQEIREIIGNTNWEVLALRTREARAALSVPAAAVVGEMSERLRDLANQLPRDRGNDAVDDALREAASRISQQDAELERMRKENQSLTEAAIVGEYMWTPAELAEAIAEARKAAFREAGQKALEWAAHYSPASDGRNTFVLFSEWAEAKAEETGHE